VFTQTRSSGFSTRIRWPCYSVAIEGLGLTLGKFSSSNELALFLAVQVKAKP
jgi:hypothetical protein